MTYLDLPSFWAARRRSRRINPPIHPTPAAPKLGEGGNWIKAEAARRLLPLLLKRGEGRGEEFVPLPPTNSMLRHTSCQRTAIKCHTQPKAQVHKMDYFSPPRYSPRCFRFPAFRFESEISNFQSLLPRRLPPCSLTVHQVSPIRRLSPMLPIPSSPPSHTYLSSNLHCL